MSEQTEKHWRDRLGYVDEKSPTNTIMTRIEALEDAVRDLDRRLPTTQELRQQIPSHMKGC